MQMKNIKREVLIFLEQDDFEKNLKDIHRFPPMKVVNALLSFLVNTNEIIKKHAVISMGEVVSKLAETDIESARIIMRRLMLSLTEESGGIGWGSPEAMGEIMARSEKLAVEYHKILISYSEGGGNFLDFEELQKGVISGLKRLAEVHPHLVKDVNQLLK